jgi:hypothetical protein
MKSTTNRLRAAALLIFLVLTFLFLHSELEWSSDKDHSHESHDLCEILSQAKPVIHSQYEAPAESAPVAVVPSSIKGFINGDLFVCAIRFHSSPPGASHFPTYLLQRSLLI